MKKIYIIGAVGTGKTTLARILAKTLKINMYELDKIVFDDDNGNIRRTDDNIELLFNEIIKGNSWIIEDVGRKIFVEGVKQADIVYYLNLSNLIIYKRCILRWTKQKIGLETYNYKPTLKSLFEMLKWAKQDIKNKKQKINYIKNNSNEYRVLTKKDIKKLMGK